MVGWVRITIFYFLLAGLGNGLSFGQKTITKDLVEPTIRSDFQIRNPLISHFTVLLQAPIHPDYELLLIGGTKKQPYRFKMGYLWLEGNELLGLYLRLRTDTPKFHPIMLDPVGGDGAGFQVVRYNSTELLLHRFDSMGRRLKILKYFFDPTDRKLLSRIEYDPFQVTRILVQEENLRFVAGDWKQTLILRSSEEGQKLRMETDEEAKSLLATLDYYQWTVGTSPEESFRFVRPEPYPVRRFGPQGSFVLPLACESQAWKSNSRQEAIARRLGLSLENRRHACIQETTPEGVHSFPLPQSTWNEFAKARPERVKDGYREDQTLIEEQIGPSQVVGNRLWFGKSFYDAEGYSGVGGFGYFDTEQRRYVLFSPPEIRNYSVSSLCVTGNVLWMATQRSSEYVGYPGSLLQFEIAEKRIQSYSFESLVQQMICYKDVLYFACQEGVAVFKNRRFYRYMIDKTLDGKYQVASY